MGLTMDSVRAFLNWFTGGSEHRYHSLVHCMANDHFWIAVTVILDLAVACGYVLIALHWSRNARTLPDIPAKRALAHMRNIFVFCGICGYLFIPIKMFWPAWRLYDMFMLFLVYFTWRYALRTRELKVIYSELGRSNQLAEDLERSRVQAKQKGFFLNALSHDLRTPLNGMVLQSSVVELNLETGDRAGAMRALEEIRASAQAAAQLLDCLLDYARLETGADNHHPTEFALGELLEEIASRLRAAADTKGISLHIGPTHGVQVHTDRLKLDRIVTNLIENGIKFTQNGSVRVEVQHAGRNAEIHVIDSGVGIDPALHHRLFEEFFQVHNHERDRTKGFGMGLAIAQRLARQLGGDVTVESAVGKGSRFSVALSGVVVSGNSAGGGNGVIDHSQSQPSAVIA